MLLVLLLLLLVVMMMRAMLHMYAYRSVCSLAVPTVFSVVALYPAAALHNSHTPAATRVSLHHKYWVASQLKPQKTARQLCKLTLVKQTASALLGAAADACTSLKQQLLYPAG
jgi:hypothetical protein